LAIPSNFNLIAACCSALGVAVLGLAQREQAPADDHAHVGQAFAVGRKYVFGRRVNDRSGPGLDHRRDLTFQACGHGGTGSPCAAVDERAVAGEILGPDARCVVMVR
jgi:hypothetical protein